MNKTRAIGLHLMVKYSHTKFYSLVINSQVIFRKPKNNSNLHTFLRSKVNDRRIAFEFVTVVRRTMSS